VNELATKIGNTAEVVVRNWTEGVTAVDVQIAEMADRFVALKAQEKLIADEFKTLKPKLLESLVISNQEDVIADGKKIQIVDESITPKTVVKSIETILALVPKKYINALYEQGAIEDTEKVVKAYLKMTNAPKVD
jgi:hypothetical protein